MADSHAASRLEQSGRHSPRMPESTQSPSPTLHPHRAPSTAPPAQPPAAPFAVICSDKTGTLTTNMMTAVKLAALAGHAGALAEFEITG